jgi:hypothetical protein
MAVAYVFPMLAAPMAWMRGVICFKRNGIVDKNVRMRTTNQPEL